MNHTFRKEKNNIHIVEKWSNTLPAVTLCLRSEDDFVITCVANLMEVKVLYVQQDLLYEISSYWLFNV
jgi:hypothetical protein